MRLTKTEIKHDITFALHCTVIIKTPKINPGACNLIGITECSNTRQFSTRKLILRRYSTNVINGLLATKETGFHLVCV